MIYRTVINHTLQYLNKVWIQRDPDAQLDGKAVAFPPIVEGAMELRAFHNGRGYWFERLQLRNNRLGLSDALPSTTGSATPTPQEATP